MMDNLKNAKKIGLRNKKSNKLVAVYPHEVTGTDDEIIKTVKDWYYQTSCGAEDQLLDLIVDELDDTEIKEIS